MAENIQLAGLVVDLLLNTASFEAGSTKAQRIANKAAKDIDREFKSLQGALSGIFAKLGPVGEAAATALDQVGSAASAAMSKLGGLGSGIGTLGAVTAGLATALASVATAVTAAMIGIAVHAAESAAKMEDLAHSTGISVEALSKLQAVGHMIAPDVSIDDIAKSLGRMNRQIVEAATASTTTITPFQRLGISIRDASGQVKSGEQIFAEIGDKFSQMQDGAIKSGLAMMIFGRSGASIIPILDEGGAKLEHIIQLGERFGAIINTQTAEAAHQFKENLAELDLVMQGIENRIMQAFLPALQSLTKALDEMAEGTNYTNTEILNATEGFGEFQVKAASLDSILQDAIGIVKLWIPILADMATTALIAANDLGEFITVMGILEDHRKELAAHPLKFWFGTAGSSEMQGQIKAVDDAVKKANNDAIDLAAHLYNAVNMKAEPKTGFDLLDETKRRLAEFDKLHRPSGVNLESNAAKQAELTIIEQIKKLQGQAEAEGVLARAISAESSATIENIAHAEALKTITEMNAVAQKYGVSVTKEQAAAIEQATLSLEAYKAALKVNKDLQENIDKTKLASEATMELAKAYTQGGEAIEQAEEKAKLSTLADAVKDIQELHDKLGQLPMSGKAAELFNTLGKSLDQAKEKLASAAVQEHAKAMADAALASAKLGDNLKFETEELQKQIAATLEGTDALRTFNAQKQIDVFVHEHPGVLTPDQIAGLRQQAAAIGSAEEELQAVQKFRSENNVKSIGDEIAELEKYHDTVVKDSTDELVYQAKMHDLLLSQQKAWDELLLKTNDTRAGVRVFFDEMAFNGQTAAERIHDTLTQTFNTLEDTFTRFVEGQKVSWKELENQILGTFAKQSIDVFLRRAMTAVGGVLNGKLGGQQEAMNEKIPGVAPAGIGSTIAAMLGIGGKANVPDGSPSNPLHVMVVGGINASATPLPSGLPGIPEFPGTSATYDIGVIDKILGIAGASTANQEEVSQGASETPVPPARATSVLGSIVHSLPLSQLPFGSLLSGVINPSSPSTVSSGVTAYGSTTAAATSALTSAASTLAASAAKLSDAAQQLSAAAQNLNSGSSSGSPLSSLFSSEGDSGSGGGGFISQIATVLPFMTAAEGGSVSGPGTSTSDSIPAMLSAGEYVVKADAVRRVGKNHLDAINSGHTIRHFAIGGDVTPGRSFLDSERQPFVALPKSSDAVMSHTDESYGGGGRGMTVVNHFHDIHDMNTFKASEGQISGHMMRSAYSAHQRNG